MSATAKETALGVLAEISGVGRDELRPEMDLVGELGIDSPKALRLLLRLEEDVNIEISDEDAAQLNTVGDILDYLEAHT